MIWHIANVLLNIRDIEIFCAYIIEVILTRNIKKLRT